MKRALEGEEPETKKAKAEGDVADLQEQRLLIDNFEAGVIIGRKGCNVQDLRTRSGCFVSILKNEVQGSKERVLVLKGPVEGNATCLQLIATLMLDAINTKNQANGTPEETEYTFKLLLHKFLAGSIIGQGGKIIKEIKETTGIRMRLSNDPLPGSTEKSCTMTGTPDVILAAAGRVLQQLYETPLRGNSSTILYVPGGNAFPMQVPYAPYGAPYGAPPMYPPAGYPGQQPQYAPRPQAPPAAGAPGAKTEKIVIPTVCAGTVIGKGGSIIRDIKMQSATNISIADPEPTAPNDRVVAITGSQQGINTAIFLIRQRVESYQPPAAAPAAAAAPAPLY